MPKEGENYNQNVTRLIKQEFSLFPEAQVQDIYKLFYQDFFGPGHYISDVNLAGEYLKTELDNCEFDHLSPKIQPIFCFNNFIRVDIRIVDELISKDEFLRIFVTSSEVQPRQPLIWKEHWLKIVKLLLTLKPEFSQDEDIFSRLILAAGTREAVHHSSTYRKSYNPHYRIITESCWQKALRNGISP